ncbi:MAG: hypothetical protein COX70_02825, partial [Flavobacteriales bacterium CG_4_10_14_0_2_um_filter_32_8]
TSAIQNNNNECDIRTIKNECLRSLKPDYLYDSYKATRFLYTNAEQVMEIEAPLFKDEKYRFIFNIAGLPKDIEVKFFDKKKGAKDRKQLYSLTKEEGKNIYIFEPEVSKKIYLNYIIPRTTQQNLSGCMVSVIGYHLTTE